MNFVWFSVFIGIHVLFGKKRSLHIENGTECHFMNESQDIDDSRKAFAVAVCS